ncbi:DUF4838 domain-containing protein [Ulvibacterium marinum]|uniref:DUF4838 domain-containing protein n=1 Tax=Ulvibacterium marinum TaxID=2419782 RepID=UPI002494FD42|nr:DUF4838 domain-containing protein [Ulvibacterium marinum]
MPRIVSLFLTTVLVFHVSCNDNRLRIFENGKSDYEIVVLGEGTESQYRSAELLQEYLQKIGEVVLDIVDENSQEAAKHKVYIGNRNGDSLESNQIVIRTKGKDLFIFGHSDLDTRYAIYEFLERYLGCKWYAPDAMKIPSKSSILLEPIDYVYTPEITTRTVHSKLFYENKSFADQQKVTYESFPYYVPGARVHTFHRFLPEEKFYTSHPEYYALRGDQRLPTQLCLTNEKVLQIVKDSVSALFARNPQASVVSVSQDDNQRHCQCDACSKIDGEEGSPSGTMIRFVNQVAADFPDKTISTLAYQYTRKPSKTKPADNVLITLCSIECDRAAPIAEKCTDFANDLEGWGNLTNNVRIWDYTTQFTNFLAPFPNIHTLRPNIQLFRDNNAKWVFEQHSHNPSELFELRSYITAKLLWNPESDLEALLVEFTEGYYGKAGIYIKAYVDLIHSELEKDEDFFLFLYGDPSEAFGSYLRPELLTRYMELFDKAENVVADSPELVARVKKARLGVDYAVLEASRKNINEKYSLVITDDGRTKKTNPRVVSLLDNFMETTSGHNIGLMNEMGFTVAEYGTNYKSALEIALKPNKAKGKKIVTLTRPKKYADENPLVLTDGALGGSSFYANWLGYEGNDMEVVLDLGEPMEIRTISLAFLQVTNHIVFLPSSVSYSISLDNKDFRKLGTVPNPYPLKKDSKVNDIQYFDMDFGPVQTRYIKIKASNTKTPYWHHAAGLPSWIFADEIIVN